ncbi:MAG: T9SS type A sorting domain-containing protein [Winogradskyella arenosi]
MKKITLSLIALCLGSVAWAQCTSGTPYEGAVLENNGTIEQQSICNFSGEYSETTGIIDGDTYTFFSDIETDFLTITSSDGSVIYGYGITPVTLTINTIPDVNDQAVNVYYHINEYCSTDIYTCRRTSVRNDTVAEGACLSPLEVELSNIEDASAELSWETNGISVIDYTVEVYLVGESASNSNTPVFANANVEGESVLLTGLSALTEYDVYINANCGGATTTSGLTSLNFTTTASCEPTSDLDLENVMSNSVVVTYTPGTGNSTFLVEIYLEGESAALGNTPVYSNASVTEASEYVANLVEETAYDAFVTGFCDGVATDLVGPESFTTVPAPPANNDCYNAQIIVQETEISDEDAATPTLSTIENALPSGVPAEVCDGFEGDANDDVWFSFVALTENVTINYDLTFDGVAVLYTGTCDNLTYVTCADNYGNSETINATDLTVGETYYTRIYQYDTAPTEGKTFEIKIWSSDESLSTTDFENESAFTYYPNPVAQSLTLDAKRTIEQVVMYNMLGQEVLSLTPQTLTSRIDMDQLPSGTYFVKVSIANTTETIRVIKK